MRPTLLLAAIVAASVFTQPAQAATLAGSAGCTPFALVEVHGEGNSLPVPMTYARLVTGVKGILAGTSDGIWGESASGLFGALPDAPTGGSPGGSSGASDDESTDPLGGVLGGANLIDQLDLVRSVAKLVRPAEIYTNRLRFNTELGCRVDDPDSPGLKLSEFAFFEEARERVSYSRELFDFANAIGPPLDFSLSHSVHRRQGIQVTLSYPFGTAAELQVNGSVWQILSTQDISLVFRSEVAAGDLERWQAISRTLSSRWNPGEVGASPLTDFQGFGYEIGASLAARPFPWLSARYTISPLVGSEMMDGLMRREVTLDTDSVYVGDDGYEWSKPLAKGSRRWESVIRTIEPRQSVRLEVAPFSGTHERAGWESGMEGVLNRFARMQPRAVVELGTTGGAVNIESIGIVVTLGNGEGSPTLSLRRLSPSNSIEIKLDLSPALKGRGASLSLAAHSDSLSLINATRLGIAIEGSLWF